MFLKSLQYSEENTCVWSLFLTKLQACNFPFYIAKFLRIAFFIKHLRWLLLKKLQTSQENIGGGDVIDLSF